MGECTSLTLYEGVSKTLILVWQRGGGGNLGQICVFIYECPLTSLKCRGDLNTGQARF